jgi:hypothetical protein
MYLFDLSNVAKSDTNSLPAGRQASPYKNKTPQIIDLAGFTDYPENNFPGIYYCFI